MGSISAPTAILASGALSAGAGLLSAGEGASAAQSAAQSEEQAAAGAEQTQLKMFNQVQSDISPYLNTGTESLYSLAQLYGLPTAAGPNGEAASAGGTPFDPTKLNSFLQNQPGYQFALDQGVQALSQGENATGQIGTGSYGRDLLTYGQNMAQTAFPTYFNQLATLAGLGSTAGSQIAAASGNAANAISSAQIGAGNASAAGTIGTANAISGGLSAATSGISNSLLYSAFSPQQNLSSFNPNAYGPTNANAFTQYGGNQNYSYATNG